MKKVIVSGYYGFGNTGDEAILESVILELAKASIEVSVLSASPEETQSKYKVKAYNRAKPAEIIKAISECDALISGGGSLFQDVTSSASIYYYLGIVTAALGLGKKVFVYSQGIGPINKNFNRFLFKKIINRARTISVRDGISYDELGRLGVNNPPINVTSDPVFLLNPAPLERGRDILLAAGLNLEEKKPMIGIALRPWRNRENASTKFAEMVDNIIKEFSARVIFFPFYHPEDQDFTFDIVNKMKNKPYIIDKQYLPSEIMSAMGLVDINIGVRLHALIFSACMGVPMVGISYDPKIEGFLDTMGLKPACSYQDLQWEKIQEAIENINSNRELVTQNIMQYAKQNKSMAGDNLELLLEELGK